MFINIGDENYINLNNVTRCEFKKGGGGEFVSATLYFAEVSNRIFVNGSENVKKLRDCLDGLVPPKLNVLFGLDK